MLVLGVVAIIAAGIVLFRLILRFSGPLTRDRVVAALPSDAEFAEASYQVLVEFRFTSYTGLVFYVRQQSCAYRLPQELALPTLRRLLKHNLTRGLLGPGCVFIPFLTLAEYWQQKRRILAQHERFTPIMAQQPNKEEGREHAVVKAGGDDRIGRG